MLSICEGRDICVNVISKSGTTTEPALAFRIFKKLVEDKYGKEEAKTRIFATTDKSKGTLKELSDAEGYETFVIPRRCRRTLFSAYSGRTSAYSSCRL